MPEDSAETQSKVIPFRNKEGKTPKPRMFDWLPWRKKEIIPENLTYQEARDKFINLNSVKETGPATKTSSPDKNSSGGIA